MTECCIYRLNLFCKHPKIKHVTQFEIDSCGICCYRILPTDKFLIKQRIKELRSIIYDDCAAGGALHIVLDDYNVKDHHIQWCLDNSIAKIDNEEQKQTYVECATLLLLLSHTSRLKLVKVLSKGC